MLSDTPKKHLLKEEMTKLLNAPDNTSRQGIRDRAILELMYSGGLRVSELTSLKLEDIAADFGSAKVLGKGWKERMVFINKTAKQRLLAYLQDSRPLYPNRVEKNILFLTSRGNGMNRYGVLELFQKYTERCIGRKIGTHAMRHSFATHLYENGMELETIQELLGHEHISTTQIYTHVSLERMISVHRKYHPRA